MTEQNQEPKVEETKVNDVEVAPEENVAADGAVAKKPNKFFKGLDNFFQISANNSTIRAEVVGGITTFFAMCYILFVNPTSMIGSYLDFIYPSEVDVLNALRSGIFIGTAIGAIIGTLLMALLAKMPYAQAPGMGLNAFFCTTFMAGALGGTIVDGVEAQYQAGLAVIFVAGIIFLLISLTGIREKIANAIPQGLKKAISAGIGLFIAYIGMQNAGVIISSPYTVSQFANFNVYSGGATWYGIVTPLLALLGVIIMGILSKSKVKALSRSNVILGIVLVTGLYYLFNIGNSAAYSAFQSINNPIDAFVNFGKYNIGRGFIGFKYWTAEAALDIVILIITFCLIDMFDTLGTLQGAATEAGLLNEKGVPQRLTQCLWCDSIATVSGSVMGVSTVTTFVESSAGISAGAKTGFSSVITAGLFLIAMFLSPLAAIIPSAATASALIFVGVLMLGNVKDIDFKDLTVSIPAFLIIFMMPLTYSISNGIGIGLIAYTVIKFFTVIFGGKEKIKAYYGVSKDEEGKKVFGEFLSGDLLILIISLIFVLRFLMVSM
ncbi:MAG: NCS2 family permease [Christensenellales bacterium]